MLAKINDELGGFFLTKQDFNQAAKHFLIAKYPEKALAAYKSEGNYKDGLAICLKMNFNNAQIEAFQQEMIDVLLAMGKNSGIGGIYLEQKKEIEAIQQFLKGNDFENISKTVYFDFGLPIMLK